MALVGKKFPNITVDAISFMGDNLRINVLEEAVNNKKKIVLFWYPKDFTFVCPTELHAFQAALPEFQNRNTVVIGASCDTNEVHFAWLNTAKDNGGIEGVTYPLLADTTRNLSKALGILEAEEVYDSARFNPKRNRQPSNVSVTTGSPDNNLVVYRATNAQGDEEVGWVEKKTTTTTVKNKGT